MWKQWMIALSLVCSIFVLGCERESRVKVTAPGVNVDVKKDGGVEVRTPGGDVKVNK